MPPRISILIPHFQTPRLTTLCLKLLQRNTNVADVETIVIDNGSTDGSGEQLAKIDWIRLLRREVPRGERPARSHGLALNLGLDNASAPLILTMHTDTMVLRPDWLSYLGASLEKGTRNVGIVGSWKLEAERSWRRPAKWIEERIRKFRGKRSRDSRYVRSHCALYLREAIDKHPKGFDPTDERNAGEELHSAIIDAGYDCQFLPPAEFGRYVCHLNHATMALNHHFGQSDRYMPRTRARAIRRIESFFESIGADLLLAEAASESLP